MSIATTTLIVGILVRDVHEQLSNLERIFLQCPVSAHATSPLLRRTANSRGGARALLSLSAGVRRKEQRRRFQLA
jgi:hypothetical protein